MAKLSQDSVPIVEGKVVLFKRPRSPLWQARFRIGNKWVRMSTKTEKLDDAKGVAADAYMEAKFKEKNNLPIISRKFGSVAEAVKQQLQKDRDVGIGPVVTKDYIQAIDNWLIPFFGNHNVASIEHRHIQQFYAYRSEKLKRDPAKSTVNTHATALRKVFEEAIAQGYMSEFQVPSLRLESGNGKRGERRPDFNIEEYRQLYRFMRSWVKKGKKGKPTQMRHLLRDYVLFLANSGIRHGTEAYNLKWKNIELRTDGDKQFMVITVNGKTGRRTAIVRANARRYLERIVERAEDIDGTFEQATKQDNHVFRLPDGTRTKHLDQTFRKCLRDAGLLVCPRTDQNRSLYSLRHFYITQSLLANKVSPAMIAHQCGTSILMLERHYAHLNIWSHREELSS